MKSSAIFSSSTRTTELPRPLWSLFLSIISTGGVSWIDIGKLLACIIWSAVAALRLARALEAI